MDVDDVWKVIDAERSSLADLLDDLSAGEWETPSLCAGWRVRDVAAHLTLAQMGVRTAALELVRAGGSFNRMIRETARRQAELPVDEYPWRLRSMVGSRRKAPGITPLEPLTDVLVHGQDIALPLGRSRSMPPAAAAASCTRVWTTSWPFHARRRLRGVRLTATDVPWSAGRGAAVEGPVAAILLLLTGRSAGLAGLTGEGMADLALRLSGRPSAHSASHDGAT